MSQAQKPGRHAPLTLSQNVGGKSKAKQQQQPQPEVTETIDLTGKSVRASPKLKNGDNGHQSEVKAASSVAPPTKATTEKEKPENGVSDKEKYANGSSSHKEQETTNGDGKTTRQKAKEIKEKETVEIKETKETKQNTSETEKQAASPPAAAKETIKESKVIEKTPDKKETKSNESTKSQEKSLSSDKKIPKVSPKNLEKKKSELFWDDQDMEPLMMEVEIDEGTTPGPQTPGRVLRLRSGPPINQSNLNKLPSQSIEHNQNNTSTMVNVSTGSTLPSESSSASSSVSSPKITKTPLKMTEESFSSNTGRVTGRRSFRPLREISFQNSYRESYRKINDSQSSLNATVGSEIHYDSIRTPALLKSGVKRDRITTDDIEHINDESPKRLRLDIGGFLGFVVSPVTMLRDRFNRSRIQSSTPNKSSFEKVDGDDIMIDTVSASNIEEDNNIDKQQQVEDQLKIEENLNKFDDIDVEKMKANKIDVDDDIIITDKTNKKSLCHIM